LHFCLSDRGGGITDPEKAYTLNCKAGADVIVVGIFYRKKMKI